MRHVATAVDTVKRRQILDGARKAFLDHGFDGASMSDVVAACGVSKATVYAYFDSKEKLFESLIFEERRRQAEQLFDAIDVHDGDVRAALSRLGTNFMAMMIVPETVQFLRMIIAVAGKFPELGRVFYEAGPAYGNERLTRFIQAQCAAGRLACDRPDIAASQFIELCKAGITVPMLFGMKSAVSEEESAERVRRAVDVFMAAYSVKSP